MEQAAGVWPGKLYKVGERFEEVVSGKSDGAGETGRALRAVTFNVMMDSWHGKPYMTQVGCHEERYAFIVEELRRKQPDVVLLNEVTMGFLAHARSLTEYFASCSPDHEHGGPNVASGMGNLVLVRRQQSLRRMFAVPLPRLDRPAVGVEIECSGGRTLTLVSVHLSALTANVERRAMQLAALATALRDCEHVIIAGDLNWHARVEEQRAPPGFAVAGFAEITFDGLANTMHQHLWPLGFEERQMALDRVLLRSKDGTVQVRNVEVVFNRPVYENAAVPPKQHSRGFWSTVAQLPWRALEQTGVVGAGDKETYLFPSDHFGLSFMIECDV